MKTATSGEVKRAEHPAADHDHVHCAGCSKIVSGPHQASGSETQPWARQCSACGVITWYELEEAAPRPG